MKKFKFRDYKNYIASKKELKEETLLTYSIWDDYDEFDEYYEKYWDDDYDYLEPENYVSYTHSEITYIRNNNINLRQIDLSSFTSLDMERKKKLKQLFGNNEEYEFRVPTFGDLIKSK